MKRLTVNEGSILITKQADQYEIQLDSHNFKYQQINLTECITFLTKMQNVVTLIAISTN